MCIVHVQTAMCFDQLSGIRWVRQEEFLKQQSFPLRTPTDILKLANNIQFEIKINKIFVYFQVSSISM